jgi:uncharacterized alkaline shock family protein YloU
VSEQSIGQAPQQPSPLQSERGNTRIDDRVVKIAGIAAQEIEGVQMGGGTARAVGGFLDSVAGGGGQPRGVAVEVGEIEAAVDLTMAVEYGKAIPQLSEAVRSNVINRIETLVGLRVTEVNIMITDVILPQAKPEQERQRDLEREARLSEA